MNEENKITDEDLVKLKSEFSLLRRPYITLAYAIKKIEIDCKNSNKLKKSKNEIKSFNFALFNIKHKNANEKHIFRMLLGYDINKFRDIIAKENLFKEKINEIIYSNTLDDLTKNYKSVIEKGVTDKKERLNFLLAVYHTTYWVNVPTRTKRKPVLVQGLVHSLHLNKKIINSSNHLFYKLKLKKETDKTVLKLHKVSINGKTYTQVTKAFAKAYESFFNDWLGSILGAYEEYPYLIYFPIYDGLTLNEGVLRGYLEISCKTPASRQIVNEYIKLNFPIIQNEINNAFLRGAHNDVLDRFMSLKNPIDHWKDNLFRLHNWNEIGWVDNEQNIKNKPQDKIWWTDDLSCYIDIEKVLYRPTVAERPLNTNKYLELTFGKNGTIFSNVSVHEDNVYIQKRMGEVISLLDDILVKWQVLKHASIAAISQVMARNMSHNIGSHVLANLSTKQKIKEIIIRNNSVYETLFDEKFESPDIAISTFNQYLKSRMDFLADIATSIPIIENSKYLLQDIIKPFHNNKLIFKQIPALANFNYEILVWGNYNNSEILSGDIYVAIPNDILGTHAFYVILENFIRNCAKHEKSNGCLKINICPIDYNKELFQIEIFSSSKNSEVSNIVNDRNKDIKSSILKEGKLRSKAWGILEMKIASGYLRKIPIEELEKENDHSLLEAFGKEGCLGYKFYIKKPKELIVINDEESITPRQGITCIKQDKIDNVSEAMNHRFLLLKKPTSLLKEKLKSKKNLLPMRVIEINNGKEVLNILKDNSQNTSAVMKKIWEENLKSIANNYKIVCKKIDTAENGNVDTKELFVINAINFSKTIMAAFHNHCKDFNPNGYDYYEIHGSNDIIGQMINRINSDDSLKYQLVETFLTKIAIIDERIQQFAFNDKNKHLEKLPKEYFERINIEIPEVSSVDLNSKNFNNDLKNKLIDWIKEKVSREFDFIVIHLGIIEKVYGTGKENITKINELLNGEKVLRKTKIIITSGRGRKPEDVPDEMLYLPYSTISQFVVENRSKYHLTQLLYATRANK